VRDKISYPYKTAGKVSFVMSVIKTQYCNVLGVLFHNGTLLHSKSQYTTVKHSQQLFEHT
jgi:hypothetical protein